MKFFRDKPAPQKKIVNEIQDEDQSILVSACDNGMLYDTDKLETLLDSDLIVWTLETIILPIVNQIHTLGLK